MMLWVNLILSLVLLAFAITIKVNGGAFLEFKKAKKVTFGAFFFFIIVGAIVMKFTAPKPVGTSNISTIKGALTIPQLEQIREE